MTRLPLISLLAATSFLLMTASLRGASEELAELPRKSVQDIQKQNLYAVIQNDPLHPDRSRQVIWMVRGDPDGKLAGFVEEVSSIREQLALRIEKIKASPDLKDFNFVWYDDRGRPQTVGTGEFGANEFLKRLRREVVYRLDAPSMAPEEDLKLLLQINQYREEEYSQQDAINLKIMLDPKQEARPSTEDLERIARGWNVPQGRLVREGGERVASDRGGWLKGAGNVQLERWEPVDENKCIAWGSIRAFNTDPSSDQVQAE